MCGVLEGRKALVPRRPLPLVPQVLGQVNNPCVLRLWETQDVRVIFRENRRYLRED